MKWSPQLYLTVLLFCQPGNDFCFADSGVTASHIHKNIDCPQHVESGNAQVVGLSRTSSSTINSIPPRPNAVAEALKLLQSIIYNIIERLREIQHKVDSLITQPVTQFFSFRSIDKNNQNDHIDCDVDTLGLTPGKLKTIYDILGKAVLTSQTLQKRSNGTHLNINAHLVYRYLSAADWSKKYNGRSYEDAIVDTAEWRENFGIHKIDTAEIARLIRNGLGYTSGFDKHGRAIVYVKIGRNEKLEESSTYQKLLMYTVERADRMCVQGGCGEFVAIIDLEGFKWSNSIPIPMIKEAVNLLKKHYPYRLGGVFILNGSSTFTLLWNMIKPIMPRKALGKTFVISKKNVNRIMCEKLGKEHIEESYGGLVKEDLSDITRYLATGYWG